MLQKLYKNEIKFTCIASGNSNAGNHLLFITCGTYRRSCKEKKKCKKKTLKERGLFKKEQYGKRLEGVVKQVKRLVDSMGAILQR